jgi:hypothetical protein
MEDDEDERMAHQLQNEMYGNGGQQPGAGSMDFGGGEPVR